MTFAAVVPHLARKGFATRWLWMGGSIVFWGAENTSWMTTIHDKLRNEWHPSLADLCANDWFMLPYFWTKNDDNHLPFDRKDPELEKLRRDGEYYNDHHCEKVTPGKYVVGSIPDKLLPAKYTDILTAIDFINIIREESGWMKQRRTQKRKST